MVSDIERPANKLLRLLEPDAFHPAPKSKPTVLRSRQVLYRPNERIPTVYFPENSMICQMTVMSNGDTLETATVGSEGASWIHSMRLTGCTGLHSLERRCASSRCRATATR
jgi:hypothetical protein